MKARSTKFYVTFAIGAITGFSVCGWMLFSIGGAGGGTDSVRPGLNKVDRTVLEVNSNSPEQLDHSSLLPAPAPKSPPTLSKSLGAAGAGEGGQTRTPIVQELKAQDAEQMREAGEEERRREEEKRRKLNQTFAQQQSSSSSPPLAISSPIPNDIAWKKNQTRVDNDLPPFDFRDSDVLAPGKCYLPLRARYRLGQVLPAYARAMRCPVRAPYRPTDPLCAVRYGLSIAVPISL
eukprot:648419-Rhodomonas_salina.1